MVGPIAMLYNIGQVVISKRENKTKPWHSLKHKLVGDSLGLISGPTKDEGILHHNNRLSLVFYLGNCVKTQQ